MAYNIEQFRKFYRQSLIPRYYSGVIHFILTCLLLSSGIVFFLMQTKSFSLGDLMIIPFIGVLGSLVVYVLHKYPLHRPIPGMGFAYKIHTLYHHKFFTHEHITWNSARDFHIVFFPLLAVIGFLFLFCPGLYLAIEAITNSNMAALGGATAVGYFLLYEVFHFCSHLPEDHPILKISVLRNMRRHHIIHHDPKLMSKANFNVVFPLWDYLLSTSVKR